LPTREASFPLPAESEPVMPQFTIKLHTYDPAIVEAFELLRKSGNSPRFTHEALRYFHASEKASQMIALMSHGHQPPLFQASTERNMWRR